MAYSLPEGSKLLYSAKFGPSVAVSDISNGDPAQATADAHGLSDGDEFLLVSGWEDATDSIWRAANVSGNTFEIESLDSSDTEWYSAGGGGGSVLKVDGWKEIQQVLTFDSSGGDAKNVEVAPLARRNAINLPAGFNPVTMTLGLGYDPSLKSQLELDKYSRNRTKLAFKFLFGGGGVVYGYGYAQLAVVPKIAKGSANTIDLTVNFAGTVVGYPT